MLKKLALLVLVLGGGMLTLHAVLPKPQPAPVEAAVIKPVVPRIPPQRVPKVGALGFGLYINTPTVAKQEADLDTKLDMLGWFSKWNQSLDSNKLRFACKNGYVPVITWESWTGRNDIYNPTYPLKDIGDGKFDEYVVKELTTVKQICGDQKVIIRFDHEFDQPRYDGPWTSWQKDPVNYVRAWQNIVGKAHTIDPNILWLWSPNRGEDFITDYYPGDAYVDYVGVTINRTTVQPYNRFQDFYGANSFIESFKKPIIVGETTYYDNNPAAKAAWVTGMFEYAHTNKQIVGIVWFNSVPEYDYNSSPESIAAFKAAL